MNIISSHKTHTLTALRRLEAHSLNSVATTPPSQDDSLTLSPQAQRLMEGGATPGVSRDARAVYRRHGNEEHSLSNRAEVGRLISRSPQVDNVSGTHNDDIRCGGAALTNALLLDGDYAANARAIRTLADPAPGQEGRLAQQTADGRPTFSMTREQREALNAMEHGHLTPNQTSHIQEMLFQMSDGVHSGSEGREEGNDGINGVQMRDMVSRLTNAGAFPNTRSLNMRMDENGAGGYHWTTTTTTDHGTHHANSWPAQGTDGHDGYAEVRGVSAEDMGDFVYQDGQAPGTFGSDVTMERPNALSRPRVSARELATDHGRELVRSW